ncbi:ABC transporter ATP-binding protein [Fibrivirga algicola]|uniref:ABC transporter ATP-binding protein n=1 Tax=Fibrivirga algicola TaxID=2950420 RepID=A0ABX0QHS7_9BACT|nr:ABC transporter ATP-binding protein [Fibrivirga algicola]ARK10291.1 ABC transporter [Fibrella sp. ES10-3-2-2]NID11794.1 ABC transporter ATP-binding protein [Fibrivirga algicola]
MTSVIDTQNLVHYYGRTQILKGINLSVAPGQVVGYIGPNGAGKSTTIKALIGLLPGFQGEVSVLGLDLRTHAMDVKRRIGYVPENAALYDLLTPVEYLNFVGQLYELEQVVVEKKALELLRLFGLDKSAHDRMTTFSKGMRQKVLLISGLLHNPDLIFLDEPLSGLDANAVVLVKQIIRQLADSGKTVFYSSHIMDVVEKISDRIIIINAGEIIADGSFTELQEQRESGNSLEQMFSQLTGSDGQNSAAEAFVYTLTQ